MIKYQVVCEVTVDGQKLGYIDNKIEFEKSVEQIINKEEENKAYTVIDNMPEYTMKLVNRTEETNTEKILAKIQDSAETTYKLYSVTVNGKVKATVKNLEEAEKLVKELNKKYEKELKTEIGITEKYTTNKKKGVVTIKKAKANINKELSKKLETKKEKEAAKAAAKAAAEVAKRTSTSLNGVKLTVTPVSGTITSRFGSRESIRSHGHTGLDICAPRGTTIKAAGSGTVIFAGYSGGYGNVVKISHGSGVKTYYAHCSKLYVSTGEKVKAGQRIAAVGSTGNSTGNHLHFEVVKNGVELNPQNYLY